MEMDTDEELVIWIAEDITERKEHTRELERHEVFLESIREEVLVTDADFVISYESAAVPKLYGYEQGSRVIREGVNRRRRSFENVHKSI